MLLVDALPFIGPLFGAPSVAAVRPTADQMRAMLIANAATTIPDLTAPDCPASRPGLPSAKLVPIPGSYHFIMQDQPTRFATELEAFLKR